MSLQLLTTDVPDERYHRNIIATTLNEVIKRSLLLRQEIVRPEDFGRIGTGNDTQAVQKAIDQGKPVLLTGVYTVDNLTIDTVGQMILALGTDASTGTHGVLKRRSGASGAILTINASRVTLDHISVQGTSSGTPGTGDLVAVANGANYVKFLDCAMYFCSGANINAGQCSQLQIRGGSYDNTQAGAGDALIKIGPTSGATDRCYYFNISGITCLPSGNPIVLYGCEQGSIHNSQISGFENNLNNLATAPGNRISSCRITGDVSDSGANTQYIGNMLGAHTVTMEAASSGILWIGERSGGSSIVNLGATSNIVIEPDQTGISGYVHLKVGEGIHLDNNKLIRLYDLAGTNYGSLGMTTGNNLTLSNNNGGTHVAANSGQSVSLIVGGAVGIRADGSTTAGQTRLLVYDVDNGTLERVTVGAADSGGAGFKVLRIPN